jgi:hypothetical protein
MPKQKWTIIQDKDKFIVIDPDTGEILHDANGNGYSSGEAARKAGWFLIDSGKWNGVKK